MNVYAKEYTNSETEQSNCSLNSSAITPVGVVVIGRNEGLQLVRCLISLSGESCRIVYVDSGSSDGSPDEARKLGVRVVELDMSRPFTAARARNIGADELLKAPRCPALIQFVDGDCEIASGWIEDSRKFLESNDEYAVSFGRLREKFPSKSVYNWLCDREWSKPIGDVKTCGGIAMMRAAAFKANGGFDEALVAGEEAELCLRFRRSGWKIRSLDQEMALHDAAITRFSQWWKRMRRGGYAFAEGAFLHGAPPERHCVRELRRLLAWGLALPLGIACAVVLFGPVSLTLALIYPLQVVRLAAREGWGKRQSWTAAFFNTLGKFAEAHGALTFYRCRLVKALSRS